MRLTLIALLIAGALPAAAQDATMTYEGLRGATIAFVPYLPDEGVDPADTWTIEDGVIQCTGSPNGYIRTEDTYSDYMLTFQWRWTGDPGNSGCLLHVQDKDEVWPKSIESQLMHENAGDFWVIGGTTIDQHADPASRRVPNRKDGVENPPGEWNTMRIHAEDDVILVWVNGELVNVATGATVTEGHIAWQSEGAPIEFRRIAIVPLEEMRGQRRMRDGRGARGASDEAEGS